MNSFEVLSCNEGPYCANSVEIKGEGAAKCMLCRLAPGNENCSNHYWKPIVSTDRHPVLLKEKRQSSIDRAINNRNKRKSVDVSKRKILTAATRAEKQTNDNIIKATKNSGRSNRDGDHTVAGRITMDTKLQSGRDNPVVNLAELDKVNRDSSKAGTWFGCLTLRNRNGVGVVVLTEDDFGRLIAEINNDTGERDSG